MRRGTCIHFRGVQHEQETCAAGVDYEATFGPHAGAACRAPCLQEYVKHEKVDGKYVKVWHPWPRNGQQEIPCDKRVMPTDEQIAEADREFAEYMAKMATVMAVVRPWKTWTKKNRVAKQEVVECPACKGRLHLSQAAYNGHVWGKCESEGCVSWLE